MPDRSEVMWHKLDILIMDIILLILVLMIPTLFIILALNCKQKPKEFICHKITTKADHLTCMEKKD